MPGNTQLSYRTEETAEVLILSLCGSFDCTHSTQASEILAKVRSSTDKHLLIDLAEVDYLDSSGLGILVAERSRWVRTQRWFRLCNASAVVQSVFQASRLDRLFEIYPSREDALKA